MASRCGLTQTTVSWPVRDAAGRYTGASGCADKNQDRLEEADARFKEIQNAYEILSDKHERAWCGPGPTARQGAYHRSPADWAVFVAAVADACMLRTERHCVGAPADACMHAQRHPYACMQV